jgi:anaerobic magnesium-protoporphyrin IX monomethyl ester cyclase
MNQLRDISVLVKDISPNILTVAGGAHSSALPRETLAESLLDVAFVGEADYSFADVCDGNDLASVKGICYRKDETFFTTETALPIENLDDLPMPAWELFNLDDYRQISRLIARRPPVTMAEFSRGCVFKCDFCASKITMALRYRKKSPERCAEEVDRMHALGFDEFMLADDIFTSDQAWAIDVCNAIYRRSAKMAWSCTNGIRVESANDAFFTALRRAGCYRVFFGFETGNDAAMKMFGKGGKATIQQGRVAVASARKAGIYTSGFFLPRIVTGYSGAFVPKSSSGTCIISSSSFSCRPVARRPRPATTPRAVGPFMISLNIRPQSPGIRLSRSPSRCVHQEIELDNSKCNF